MGRPRRLRTRFLAGAFALALACAIVTASSPGASTSVTVTTNIASSTSFTDACQSSAATSLGIVQPTTPSLTATGAGVCRFTFGSTNNTSSLRIRQADSLGTAMTSVKPSWNESRYPERLLSAVDVAPGDANAAWAVDRWGGAQRTTNGSSWSSVTDTGNPCGSVAAVSATSAWATCNGGVLLKTTNGGSSWVSGGTMATTQDLADIDIAGAVIWVVGLNSTVRRSVDGGATWTTPAGGGLTDYWTGDVEAVSATTAYIAGDADAIFKTTDGGATWARVDDSWVGGCEGLHAPSATVLWQACDGGRVAVSSNGGSTWTDVSVPDYWALKEIRALDATTAVAVGYDGAIWRTSTGGASWVQETGVTANELVSVALHPSGKAYAVAWGNTIISSPDAGDTWAYQSIDGNGHDWLDAATRDGNVTVLVGGDGAVATTSDGGVNWTNRTSGTARHLRGVVWTSGTNLVAVGDAGTVLRSTDSGATWSSVASPTTENLLEIDRSDDGQLLAVGTRRTILRSRDNGATWTQLAQSGTSKLDRYNDVEWVGESTAYVVGDGETLMRTTDGGTTWTELTIGADPWTPYQSVAVSADGQKIFAWAYWGEVWRSLDGGATWALAPGGSIFGRGQDAVWHGAGVITGISEGEILSSDDSLTTATSDDQWWSTLRAFDAIDPSRMIAAGNGGRILRMLPPAAISDYGGGNTWATGNVFGVCLQAVGGAALADWTVDAAGTPNRCESVDTDPWRAVTIASSMAAHLTAPGTGSVDLVFGAKPAANQAPATYRAKVMFEVIAP